VVSYPGAKLQHAYHIIKNKTERSPDTQIIILNFGTNDRGQPNVTTLGKIIERILGALKQTFPSATTFFNKL